MRGHIARHLAETWHWVALGLTVIVIIIWHGGDQERTRIAVLALLAWEALGTWGHYALRRFYDAVPKPVRYP